MSIVLNEREWAIEMVERSDLGKKPSETLRRVARMYIDDGLKNDVVKKRLSEFIIKSNPGANVYSWDDAVSRAIASAQKYPAIYIERISIKKTEMRVIKGIKGRQTQRLAFTLLCLAKYWNIVKGTDGCWVGNPDKEIMRLANINTSVKRQSAMYHTLMELGLIQFSKMVDNTSVRVLFVEDSGRNAMHVTDFRNLGFQYLMFNKEPYFVCQNCGITTKIANPDNPRRQKYCKECASEIAVQQRINSIMRQRKGIGDAKYTVYMHECPNGKRYVGTTSTDLNHRWKMGIGYDRHSGFFGDIAEFGWENIGHYVIAEEVPHDLAKTIESLYIRKYNTTDETAGYNRSVGEIIVDIGGEVEELYPPIQTNCAGLRVG